MRACSSARLIDAGPLEARGGTKGRFCVATAELLAMRGGVLGARIPLRDPYAADGQLEIAGVV